MNSILEFVKSHMPHFLSQRELDEAYLNESVDIYDLERRIQELDHRVGNLPWQTDQSKFKLH